MAGFYIHIPFCRKQCFYCDFHFTVSLKQLNRMIGAITEEIKERKHEFAEIQIDTIYFGGGTPSILSTNELSKLISLIQENYQINPDAEITLEANPDDLSQDYLSDLRKETTINRLSIGVQSFNDEILKFLNRQHNSKTAYKSIIHAQNEGFDNINIDLIYGIPGMEGQLWRDSLRKFRALKIPHLSAYHLTIEPKTVFSYYLKKGKIRPVEEEESLLQFRTLLQFAKENNYEHYEISNFSKPGYLSRHNLSYWNGDPYIGIGPSAHSYNQKQRRWNVSNNTKYCHLLLNNSDEYFEYEEIDTKTAFNEYLMTSLRTSRGIEITHLKDLFGAEYLSEFESSVQTFLKQGSVIKEGEKYCLSNDGKFIADYVISELMTVG